MRMFVFLEPSDDIVGFLHVGSTDAMPEPLTVDDLAASIADRMGEASPS